MAQSKKSARTATSTDQSEKQKPAEQSAEKATRFPVVGLGSSAGGLESLKKFFKHIQPDSGCAYIVVQHLDPHHESMLPELLQHHTRMEVKQITDGMQIKPNVIYVTPQNQSLQIDYPILQLKELSQQRGMRFGVDTFFKSLAQNLKENAIAVILSGAGTDGTLGAKAINSEGGIVLAENPQTAKNSGMPQSVIDTGMVDYVLNVEDMPDKLIGYINKVSELEKKDERDTLQKPEILDNIFSVLRNITGHDFCKYKRNTTMRRIARRMVVNHIESIDKYLELVKKEPAEAQNLFRELLIGVTSFFRDKEAFQILDEHAIQPLVKAKSTDQFIRVWITGCATGEEAYSIAILVNESLEKAKKDIPVQVFATDLDKYSIEKAREGIYTPNNLAELPEGYLDKYFYKQSQNFYKVNKSIRDMVVFAEQDLIKDPPFSRIDLISCRNLLIYMNTELQQRVISLFHYSLVPGGYLFLGTSESLGKESRLFKTVNSKWRLFRKRENGSKESGGFGRPFEYPIYQTLHNDKQLKEPADGGIDLKHTVENLLLREFSPPCVIVNEQNNALYFHGRTGKYLEPPTGEASLNILQMVKDDLRVPLISTLRKAATNKNEPATYRKLITFDQSKEEIQITVKPIKKPESMQGLMMVIFETVRDVDDSKLAQPTDQSAQTESKRIEELEKELLSTQNYLQTTIEELETSNEELKSTNEELHSSNEELQSTNEELETSKEELQSVNEELRTVNAELEGKIEELSNTNNDMKNFLASTAIGTIFLDNSMNIIRFTPSATDAVNLIDSDIGRPICHIANNLVNCDLVACARKVLESSSPQEHEVRNTEGKWFQLRLLPYRTVEDRISGVVITLTDISRLKKVEHELQERKQTYDLAMESAEEGMWDWDIENDIIRWNPMMYKLYGYAPNSIEPTLDTLEQWIHDDDRKHAQQTLEACLEGSTDHYEIELRIKTRTNTWKWVHIRGNVTQRDDDNQPMRMVGVALDISQRKEYELQLKESKERFETIVETSIAGYFLTDADLIIRDVNRAWLDMNGFTNKDEVIGKSLYEGLDAERSKHLAKLSKSLLEGNILSNQQIECSGESGDTRYHLFSAKPVYDKGVVTGIEGFTIDITELQKVQEQLEKTVSEQQFFMHAMSHDIRSPLVTMNFHVNRLRDECGDTITPEQEKYLGRLESELQRMQNLIEQLLLFFKTTHEHSKSVTVCVGDILNNLLTEFEGHIANSGASVRIADNFPNVTGDPLKIQMVFHNLISNAIKFSSKIEGQTPEVEIGHTDADSSNEMHCFYVKEPLKNKNIFR